MYGYWEMEQGRGRTFNIFRGALSCEYLIRFVEQSGVAHLLELCNLFTFFYDFYNPRLSEKRTKRKAKITYKPRSEISVFVFIQPSRFT